MHLTQFSCYEFVCFIQSPADFKLTREAQDAYAIESYKRAADAWKAGHFAAEVVPVDVPRYPKQISHQQLSLFSHNMAFSCSLYLRSWAGVRLRKLDSVCWGQG